MSSDDGGLLLVHAHPDDEVFSTGGSIARALAEGRRVDLVVCTGGEEGEIHDPDLDPAEAMPRLRAIRAAELRCSLDALRAGAAGGTLHLHELGHRDSGMMGTPGNEHPDAFWQADLVAAMEPVARLVRAARPAVLVHYDSNGGYGHPDHINAHKIALAAYAAAADPDQLPDAGPAYRIPKRYETAWSRARWARLTVAMQARGLALPWDMDEPVNEDATDEAETASGFGQPDDVVTTRVDVEPWVAAKRAAMECHRTQRHDFGWALDLPDDLHVVAFGEESFVLRELDGAEPPAGQSETSLFEGL